MSPALDYLRMVPALKGLSEHQLWMSYDAEADVLYVNFKKPSNAEDSELGEDDVIVRRDQGQIIGYTILHVSHR
jgi:uncharacterized protein YuzE